jgi:hypothetical protein
LGFSLASVAEDKLQLTLDMHTAACVQAVSRVAAATRERGLYP